MAAVLAYILNHAWLVPGLPFLSFLGLALFVRAYSAKATAIIANLAVLASLLCSAGLAWAYFSTPSPARMVPWKLEWLNYQDKLSVSLGVLVDPLSLTLMLVVTSVSFLVHFYSLAYMQSEPGKGRFFVFLNLFTASMLGLVVAPNLVQMFVCWELVGVSSFLLIGFYYTKPEAVAASKKAFIVTRFADLGFFLGLLSIGTYGVALFPLEGLSLGTQAFDFNYLCSSQFLEAFSLEQSFIPGMSALTLSVLLLFMGAAGKSAMFPLHIWLPDAMEGPTPVSALIHAATMVVAGVYLIARIFPIVALSQSALMLIAGVGTFTCLFAAILGCAQNDFKRILAFSTLSQIGYMMLALGVAGTSYPLGYSASIFHLFTHAFFKALLFLCAGAAIHAVHSNNIWDMGGLWRKMPLTHICFLIATLAISGIWPFSGFFSKDEILLAALYSGHTYVFAIAIFVAGLTAFYMSRLYFVCFWGPGLSHGSKHAQEAPWIMLVVLTVLAALSMCAGFVPIPEYVYFASHSSEHAPIWLPFIATGVALAGIFSAWFFYAYAPSARDSAVGQFKSSYILLRRKFYVDEFYLFVTHRLIFALIARPAAWFDRNIVDGAVNLSAWCTRNLGALTARMHTGQVQTYGTWLTLGMIIFVFWVLWA